MVAEAMRLRSSAEAHRRLSQIIDAASIPAALAAIAAAVALTDLAPVLLVDAGPPQTLAVTDPTALRAIATAVTLANLAALLLVDAGPPQAIAVAAAPILRGLHQRLQICCRMREVAARSGETSRRARTRNRVIFQRWLVCLSSN